ncbi:23S rRNA (adenine(2030)-N(6))-methyltransferase RlmJ [Minwuia sp.]|uniref:23S rRNA (adenine(2030)-N(6))-methyltransferase RlmJ n=1 Tax=Minwuia sp. TaxID=2493630 RepID=UPI003A91A4E9
MLSYRHGFHAGNHADVLKHAVYAFCLDYMLAKPKPFAAIDTHAGAGIYDLTSEMSGKTGEWRDGVLKIWDQDLPELFHPFTKILKGMNPDGDLRTYPGSPEIAARLLRPADRLLLCELHPADQADLDAHIGHVARRTDGLQALIKASPPKERRGIALIDPSYEIKRDYDDVADAVIAAHRRFSTGTYLIWYPVVDRARTEAMISGLADSGIRNQYRIELAVRPDDDDHGMTASGLLIINPPWRLPDLAEEALPRFGELIGGQPKFEWIVPE